MSVSEQIELLTLAGQWILYGPCSVVMVWSLTELALLLRKTRVDVVNESVVEKFVREFFDRYPDSSDFLDQ